MAGLLFVWFVFSSFVTLKKNQQIYLLGGIQTSQTGGHQCSDISPFEVSESSLLLPTYLPSYLPTYLPIYLSTYLPT